MFLLGAAGAPPVGVGAGAGVADSAARRGPVIGEAKMSVAKAMMTLAFGGGPDLAGHGSVIAAAYSHTIRVKRQRLPGIQAGPGSLDSRGCCRRTASTLRPSTARRPASPSTAGP